MQFGLLSLDEQPSRSLAGGWEEDLREIVDADRLWARTPLLDQEVRLMSSRWV